MPTLMNNNDGPVESTVYSQQPWWQGFGNNSVMPSSGQQEEGRITNSQSQGNGKETNKNKETEAALQSGLNGSTNVQQVDLNSQMELVGHSIMLTSYPYSDPQYMTYGAPLLHPTQLVGYQPGRMPLPIEMEEEPVYVNAKQYHGILRRRQIRAKDELERKMIKNRKPYLHESRHQHALRRARGSGGRFTKKQDDNISTEERSKHSNITPPQSHSSSSAHFSPNSNGISDQFQEMQKEQQQTLSNENSKGMSISYYANSTGHSHLSDNTWSFMANRGGPHGPHPSK